MTTIDTSETTFTADREDIASNLDSGAPLTDFLVPVGADGVSTETRTWAREYVEAITEALPYQAEQDAVAAVISELVDLKADHAKDATDEITESAEYYGFDVQTLTFTAETATVVLASREDAKLTDAVTDELCYDIQAILSNHHAGHLSVVLAKVVLVTE